MTWILAVTQTPAPSNTSATLIQLAIAVLGGGGLIAGIVAFLKLRPERDSIVVTAAQGALLIQSGVVDELQEQLKEMRAELNRSRSTIDEHQREVTILRREVDQLRSERDGLLRERAELRVRIGELETRCARLENGA